MLGLLSLTAPNILVLPPLFLWWGLLYASRLLLAAGVFGGRKAYVCDILREAGLGVPLSNGEEHR